MFTCEVQLTDFRKQVEDAEALQRESFDLKIKAERAEEEATKPKADEKAPPRSPSDLVFLDDPVLYITEKFKLFVAIAQRDPVEAVRFVPEIAGGLAIGVVTLLALIIGLIGGGAAAAPSKEQIKEKTQQAKDAAAQAKDKAADAIASGTDKANAEINKRTTRSSAQ